MADDRCTVAITHGRSATDHARFGRLSIDTMGPDNANAHAPSAAAEFRAPSSKCCLRNTNAPAAAIGSGSATQRLNEITSDGSSLTASVSGISSWFSASEIADCPAATYGSHQGACPLNRVCRSQRWRDQKKNDRSRTKNTREVVKTPRTGTNERNTTMSDHTRALLRT